MKICFTWQPISPSASNIILENGGLPIEDLKSRWIPKIHLACLDQNDDIVAEVYSGEYNPFFWDVWWPERFKMENVPGGREATLAEAKNQAEKLLAKIGYKIVDPKYRILK